MLKELVLVRHGLCTGNVADRASAKGDHSLFTDEFRGNHSDTWPLVPWGVKQSQMAGMLIRNLISNSFDYFATSGVLRSVQTAQEFGFNSVQWDTDGLLRERDWGGYELLPYPERERAFEDAGIAKSEDGIDWKPLNGESMQSVRERMNLFLRNAHRVYAGKKILVVTHGGPIQAVRVIHHKTPPSNYIDFIGGDNYIRNCQIVRYLQGESGGFHLEEMFFLTPAFEWVRKTSVINPS